jgi:hypothetical protein
MALAKKGAERRARMSEKKKDELWLKKFGSVTVLNGHIHQAMQKVENSVTFHTAPRQHSPNHSRARPTRRGR